MKKTVIVGILISFCFTALHASDASDLIRDLQKLSSNSGENKELLKNLIQEKNIAEQLQDLFFADTATMLKRLGDDNFNIRETATLMLSMRMPEESDKIKEYMAKTNDPEVKVRCRQILENQGKNVYELPNTMTYAFQIVFSSPEKSTADIDFLRCYFRNFSILDSKAQSLLFPALKRSSNYQDKLVKDIIAAYKKDSDNGAKDKWIEGLKAISEDFYLSTVKRITIEREAKSILDSISQDDLNSSGVYGEVEKKLLKIPGFDLIKENFIKQCFKSGKPFRVILGVRMMRHNPEIFIKDMIHAVIYGVKTRYALSMIDTQLEMINNRKRLFRKYTPLFLNSKSDELLEFGLYLIDDPDKYKPILLKRMLADANPKCVKFLKYHYPDEISSFQQMLIAKIKGITCWKYSCAYFPQALRILEYDGHELDDYFANNHLDVRFGIDMHVAPIVIAENALLNSGNRFFNHELEYLIDNVAPKNRDVVLRAIEQYLEKFSSYMFVYPLLKRAPELTNAVVAQIEKIGDGDTYDKSRLLQEQVFQIGELLENNPQIEDKFESLTESGNDYVRLFSNTVLLSYKKDNNRYADKIINIFSKGTSDEYAATVLPVFLKSASPEKLKECITVVLDKYPNAINEKTAGLFTSKAGSALPVLINYFKTNSKGLIENMNVLQAGLHIDKNNQEILSYIQKQYNTSKGDLSGSYPLLEYLTSIHIEIDIPERLYNKWTQLKWRKREFLFAVIKNSPRNIHGVYNFLSDYLSKHYIGKSNFLSEMQESKIVADALLPLFMKELVTKAKISLAVNILKSFPDYMKKHISEIEKVYTSLEDPKDIDDMGYMIAALRQDGSVLVPAVEEHYKNEKDDSRKLCYYFVMASIHPDKNVRKESATKLVSLMKMFNDKNNYIINRFIMTSGYIALEFPDILNPFLLQCAEEGASFRQYSAIEALMTKQPYPPAAISLIHDVLLKKLSGIDEYTRFFTVAYFLKELKVIPKSLHPLIKELAKSAPFSDFKKIAARLK